MVALEWRQSSGGEASGIEIHIGGGIGKPEVIFHLPVCSPAQPLPKDSGLFLARERLAEPPGEPRSSMFSCRGADTDSTGRLSQGCDRNPGMPPATSFASPPCPVVPRNPEKGGGASRVHYLSDHPLPFSHSPYQTIRDSAPGVLHSGKKPDLR
ncbi:hypothetical protein MG293_012831 [Ovis ammon polii]|uniref:Uncharacterized protein n=1 Tax=Ovis ammon polii TaxID=230172 RepID=A0AAD4TXX2_OVIAM|nr:hypothetical protein MG293_012831 [Ovis ammon polii]